MSDATVGVAFEQAQRGAETVAESAAATNIDVVVAVRRGQPTGGLVGQSIWLDDDLTGGILEPGAVDGALS